MNTRKSRCPSILENTKLVIGFFMFFQGGSFVWEVLAWDGSMAREMETNGDLEELGVEEQRVELWIRIETP